MKPPRPKPHLIISELPLQSGIDHEAYCSTEKKPVIIVRARWIWTGEDVATVEDFFGKLGQLCRACREAYLINPPAAETRVNLYGAISGIEQEG